jgi:3D (Asp-Asp-Asp) domain-containing protein/peptidoglycan hydrolase CwlO-like protein
MRAALVATGAVVLFATPPIGTADRIAGLRAYRQALISREHSALVDLYALDSRLDNVRSELAGLDGQIASTERKRREAGLELRAARRTLAVAQRRLGNQVRVLYEEQPPDSLSVILGASSLDELISGLDGLNRTASASGLVTTQALRARSRVERAARSLSAHRRALERLRTAAESKAAQLESAREERNACVARLQDRVRLDADQITAAEAEARAAEARAKATTAEAQVVVGIASFGAQTVVSVPGDPRRPTAGRTLTVLSTGYSLPGTTATGLPVAHGIVAVDPTVIPLGTRLTIPGYGEGVAADTGSGIAGFRIDLWFPTRAQALAWGWRTVTITLR